MSLKTESLATTQPHQTGFPKNIITSHTHTHTHIHSWTYTHKIDVSVVKIYLCNAEKCHKLMSTLLRSHWPTLHQAVLPLVRLLLDIRYCLATITRMLLLVDLGPCWLCNDVISSSVCCHILLEPVGGVWEGEATSRQRCADGDRGGPHTHTNTQPTHNTH